LVKAHHAGKFRFLTEQRNLSVIYSVQTGSVTHPASYSMGTGGSMTLGKAAGAWSWQATSI